MSAVTVLVVYRALPGRENLLLEKIARHAPTLRAQGLLSDRPEQLFRAGEGHYVELVEWKSEEASLRAHSIPAVLEVWGSFEGVADFVSLAELPADVSHKPFPKLEPVQLRSNDGMTYADNMLSAKNLESLAAFYENSFGLVREVQGPGFVTLRDDSSHQRLCLCDGNPVTHMSSGIRTRDREAALRTLERNGASVVKRWEYDKMLGANLTDPEGNEFLVWQERP